MKIIKDDAHALIRMYQQNPELREMTLKDLYLACCDIAWADVEVVKTIDKS